MVNFGREGKDGNKRKKNGMVKLIWILIKFVGVDFKFTGEKIWCSLVGVFFFGLVSDGLELDLRYIVLFFSGLVLSVRVVFGEGDSVVC